MNTQKIRHTYETPLKAAMSYYRTIATLNGIKLSINELELLGYLGTEEFAKEGFIEMFNSSEIKINKLISSLKRKHLLLKGWGRVELHPSLSKLDFSKPVELNITLEYEAS